MNRNLNVIHIGKCGGGTVKRAIKRSASLAKKFDNITITHTAKARYSENEDYLIIIRNPIERAISAFNWRHYLVVDTEKQRNRFEDEWQVLKKYSTLNSISQNLYSADNLVLNKKVSGEFKAIHHLREDISFHLSGMLERVNPVQIYGVIKQHSLVTDCQSILGPNVDIEHDKNHGVTLEASKRNLSDLARRNLRRFLHEDFACILKLYNLGLITWSDYELLTR